MYRKICPVCKWDSKDLIVCDWLIHLNKTTIQVKQFLYYYSFVGGAL